MKSCTTTSFLTSHGGSRPTGSTVSLTGFYWAIIPVAMLIYVLCLWTFRSRWFQEGPARWWGSGPSCWTSPAP
ncbi:MAG: hypothetical protein M0C28_31075 [Candidatus Moduliflexus flocculans]|nr:hypothetical protein [Candidatus Moduliflexus flocculans]